MSCSHFYRRIDRAQENLHYVLDISDNSGLYILYEEDLEVSPKSSQSDEEGGVTAADQLTPTSPKLMMPEEEMAAAAGPKSSGKPLQSPAVTQQGTLMDVETYFRLAT